MIRAAPRVIVLVALTAFLIVPGGFARGVREGTLYDAPRGTATEPLTIVPGISAGPIAFTNTKERVFKVLGNPDSIYYGDTRYTVRDTPALAYYVFRSAGLSILFQWERIQSILILSEQYEFPGGIRVGMDASRAVAVLGPLQEEGSMTSMDLEVVPVHSIYADGESLYRLASFDERHLTIKIDMSTNRILELRLAPEIGAAFFDPFLNIEEPVSEKEATAMRKADAHAFSGTGIPLNTYSLVVTRREIRTAANEKYLKGQRFETHFYVLKSITRAEMLARESSFVDAIDSFGEYGPGASYVASRFGLPTVISTTTMAADYNALSLIIYARLWLGLDPSSHRLTNLFLYGGTPEYRYKGKVGIGSTLDEVFAALGKPIRTLPKSQEVNGGASSVLYTGKENGHDSADISYPLSGIGFHFLDGKVFSMIKNWK